MEDDTPIVPIGQIANKIFLVRDPKVMFDGDLAELYKVETRVLNQAVRRNIGRFPEDFMFQLNKDEYDSLTSQNVILENSGRGRHRKYLPYVFTEHGAIMLATVLRSDTASKMSVFIVRAFIELRNSLPTNKQLSTRIESLEKKDKEKNANINLIVNAVNHLISQQGTNPITRKEVKGFRK